MTYKWNRIDPSDYYNLREDDFIIYAREKTEGGYTASETNQLVFNLKKPKDANGQYWKKQAINEFINELSAVKFPEGGTLIPAPSSKRRNSEKFDDRIDQVVKCFIEKYRPDLKYEPILEVREDTPSSHSEGGTRNPNEIKACLIVSEFSQAEKPKTVFIIDDVITSGGHFKAWREALEEKYPSIRVVGVFLARTI